MKSIEGRSYVSYLPSIVIYPLIYIIIMLFLILHENVLDRNMFLKKFYFGRFGAKERIFPGVFDNLIGIPICLIVPSSSSSNV